MPIQQWAVYDFPYPSEDQPHPCVVISNRAVIDNAAYEFINCLLCVSFWAGVPLKYFHVRLAEADGLDNATVAKCNEIFRFEKRTVGRVRGQVTRARMKVIVGKLAEIFGLSGA